LPDGAIAHWLAAGETLAAIGLVEREIQPAFDREDWPSVRRWLSLLPDETIRERTPLLLAKGWLAHLRGQAGQLKSTRHALEEQLDLDVLPPAERAAARAELDVMLLGTTLPMQIDPEGALATAQAAIANLLPERRFQYGVAWACYGMALQAAGQGHEALDRLAWWAEEERVDAASSRGLFGLLFVHWQAGNLSRILSLARTTHEIGSRHRLRLITGWGHRFLGDALYERNDLAGAIEQFAAVARDYEYFHLTGLREVFFGLAQAYLASGRPAEAWSSLRRVREIMLDADALEHLPALDAEEAYLALLAGDLPRALEWALVQTAGVDSATLYVAVHPVFIRAAILCAAGGPQNLAEAMAILTDLRHRAARAHYVGPLVRVDALLAIAHLKLGEREAGLAAMQRSLATGLPQGYCRTYLDLLPVFGDELRLLAPEVEYPLPLRAALETQPVTAAMPALPPNVVDDLLTERERDVLAALSQRLSYKEVAERLFISPLTVKRHASSIYSKLGVTGRTEAIRFADERGVAP
jgi:ATP/maltotriose-dependent transcriptional regulator MalT